MKRLLIAMLLVVVPTVAFAFDETRDETVRIGVLRGSDALPANIAAAMQTELRKKGFEAFDALRTYDELIEDGAAIADYYVEVVVRDASSAEHGGIGIGSRHVGVSLGVVTSRLSAELRIYDGDSMELVHSHDLFKRNTAVAPTSVGVGGGSLFAYIAAPYIERAQMKRLVRETGRSAALLVAEVAASR